MNVRQRSVTQKRLIGEGQWASGVGDEHILKSSVDRFPWLSSGDCAIAEHSFGWFKLEFDWFNPDFFLVFTHLLSGNVESGRTAKWFVADIFYLLLLMRNQ